METLLVSKTVFAPIEEVWASWDDFGNIYRFNPGVRASRLLTDEARPTGDGSRRECDLADGKNWVREEITAYEPQARMEIEVYESSLPLERMIATLEFARLSGDRTEVSMTVEFRPKFGLVGRLMAPLMKRRFAPMLRALLDGNAEFLEKGETAREAA